MAKSDITVDELVSKIQRGELVLPEIQRRYVWRATRVRDLLDSLYRSYPSGSILVWETDHAVPVQTMGVGQEQAPTERKLLLLDGQQRLTSLSAVIRGEKVTVRGRKRPLDILFNLEHPEGGPLDVTEVDDDEGESESDQAEDDQDDADETSETDELGARFARLTFVVSSRRLASMPNWVSVSRVFASDNDAEFLEKAGIENFRDPRYNSYIRRLARLRGIRKYSYTMYTLERSYSYEEVAEIFVRVNSLGVKLRSADVAMAQISARWRGCNPLFEKFQEELEDDDWTLDTGYLLRAAVIVATGQCRFKTAGTIPVEHLKKSWDQAQTGLRFACNFLKTRAGMEEETVLSSPLLLLPVMAYSLERKGRLSEAEQQALIHWAYIANMKAWYSNSSETTLDEDLAVLAKGGQPSDLTERMRQQVGRLDVRAADFVGRGQRNALFPTSFLALRARGAKDWHSGVGISLVLSGRNHRIEWHHIFPKAVLKQAGYEKGETNEIANMAFIGGTTNRRIGKRSPIEYLEELYGQHGDVFLRQHAIPSDRSLWNADRYREFLAARRELLTQAVNELIETYAPNKRGDGL